MTMRISRIGQSKQSRLAGFFLCGMWLAACSDPQLSNTNFSLQQAKLAEQKALLSKALPLYQKAAAEGETEAITAVLRLMLPTAGVAELSSWLQSLPLSADQRRPFLAQLGLWQQLSATEAVYYQQQWTREFSTTTLLTRTPGHKQNNAAGPSHCALQIQPVLSTEQSATQWQKLAQQWQQDPQLSTLALCFNMPVFLDSQQLGCSEKSLERIQCDPKPLADVVLQSDATQLLVLAGRGGASYNNGWIQLPETATLPLLRHEMSHLFGFMDEYPLSPAIADSECIPGRITPNLLFSKDDLPAYLARWQLKATEVQLTAVDSCKHTDAQAYRVVAADSHLQHYELAMPDLYVRLIRQQLKQPAQLMPVAYYFAYLARQQQDWNRWQQMIESAAKAGYPPAQLALAEAGGHGLRRTVR